MSRAGDGEETDDSFLREVARIEEPSVELKPRPPGTRFGRYVLRGELGRGGMGVVYRAEDEQLGRTVALKLLPQHRSENAQRRARFLREARSAAALVHRNVVVVHELGEVEGELFIAMELVPGESLRARLAREGALPVEHALRLARGILRALGAAHAGGIVHRDLKPENVMIDAEGEPKVLDFGLAKLHDVAPPPREVLEKQSTAAALTEEGHLLGTPGYMSPEQARGDAVDGRSDLFSFGAVLYEMLAGARAFTGTSTMDVVIATARDEPRSLGGLRPRLPSKLVALVSQCLSKSAEARPASAREVEVVIEGLASAPAAAPSARPRATAWGSVLVAAALVMVVGGVIREFKVRSRIASSAPSVVPAMVDAGVARPRAITEWPPPKTNNPAAAAAYASALQNLRDASIAAAGNDLERAVKLDPSLAAAYLRLLQPYPIGHGHSTKLSQREIFAAASQSRALLDARDQLLLFAVEPLIAEATDWGVVAARFRAVLAEFPDDPETLMALGWALLGANDRPGGRAAFERAGLVDPSFALASWGIAVLSQDTDLPEERRAVDRCLSIAPTAASCLRLRGADQSNHGQCADYEETARATVAVDPLEVISLGLLADAIAANGEPVDAVRGLLDKAASLDRAAVPTRGPYNAAIEALALALYSGDFPAAEAAARAGDLDAADKMSEEDHVRWAMALIGSYEEEGQASKSLDVALDFERRAPAWLRNDSTVRLYLLYTRHHAGLIGDAAFTQALHELESGFARTLAPQDVPAFALHVHAAFADKSDLADALPYALDLSNREEANPYHELFRGRVLVMAGRAGEAIEPLRRAAGACHMLPVAQGFDTEWVGAAPFMNLHAHLWLGRALEATGDTAGACSAYGNVLARWGRATPRSVTRDFAKARSRALHCDAAAAR